MHRAEGVGKGALGMTTLLLGGGYGSLQVPRVIHGIENAEDINAVCHSPLDELVHQVVSIVAVAENVLAAKEHLLRRLGHDLLQFTDALPGVFTQVADAGIKGGATPAFHGPEAQVVKFLGYGQHVIQAHASGKQ